MRNMTGSDWTQERVRDLLAHARQAQPGWSWKLSVRPETLAMLDPKPGALSHPDPGLAPLDILTFDGCELAALDLLWDIVLVSAVDTHGFTHNQVIPSYWLDLSTGVVEEWTKEAHVRLTRGT